MIAATRRRVMPAVIALTLAAGTALAATPAAANRAWVLTETIFLDRPDHRGRMVGQYQTCDEVRILEIAHGWSLASGPRGQGWVQNGMLSRFQPAGCRGYDFGVFPIRPHHHIRPPDPVRPPHPVRPPRRGYRPDQSGHLHFRHEP